MSKAIYILNGPNLNRLGKREPEIYGHTTLAEIETMCRETVADRPLEFRQSNKEHELIEWIHEAIDEGAGIIINPAAFTFTSMAIMDALKMFPGPIIELHITQHSPARADLPQVLRLAGGDGGDRRARAQRLRRGGAGDARAHGLMRQPGRRGRAPPPPPERERRPSDMAQSIATGEPAEPVAPTIGIGL